MWNCGRLGCKKSDYVRGEVRFTSGQTMVECVVGTMAGVALSSVSGPVGLGGSAWVQACLSSIRSRGGFRLAALVWVGFGWALG